MQKVKILLGFAIILSIGFIGLQIFEQDVLVNYLRPVILPILVVTYCISKKEKSSNFFYFLLFYAIAELLGLFSYFAMQSYFIDSLLYYGGNMLYITAYVFLILQIVKPMNIKNIFNRFPAYVLILIVLDIYSIVLVSDIAIKSDLLYGTYDYLIEIAYNSVIMLLLTLTLINYISRYTKKAMNLLLGALCIVFSEVIQVAYFYVSDQNILSVAYSILLVVAFAFFYIQASLVEVTDGDMDNENYKTIDKLEA
jgi:hypothetical protein